MLAAAVPGLLLLDPPTYLVHGGSRVAWKASSDRLTSRHHAAQPAKNSYTTRLRARSVPQPPQPGVPPHGRVTSTSVRCYALCVQITTSSEQGRRVAGLRAG